METNIVTQILDKKDLISHEPLMVTKRNLNIQSTFNQYDNKNGELVSTFITKLKHVQSIALKKKKLNKETHGSVKGEISKGYKADNEAILGGVVFIFVLVNQPDSSTVVCLSSCKYIRHKHRET